MRRDEEVDAIVRLLAQFPDEIREQTFITLARNPVDGEHSIRFTPRRRRSF